MTIPPDALTQHADLLLALQSLDYAAPTLAQLQRQYDIAQGGLAAEQAGLASLQAQTAKELKEWKDIEARTFKRLWVTIKHPIHHRERLTALQEQEEKDYIAALTAQRTADARIAALQEQVGRITTDLGQLRVAADTYATKQQQLADLYHRVFNGPSPTFPREDALEQAYNTALGYYHQVQGAAANEQHALALLGQAEEHLSSAVKTVSGAADYATINAYGGPANFDIIERTELASAQREADIARVLVEQARALQPKIPGLGNVTMPKGNLVSDVFFDTDDTTWSEMEFRARVDGAEMELQRVLDGLRSTIGSAQGHVGTLVQQGQAAGRELENKRLELEAERKAIMMRGGI